MVVLEVGLLELGVGRGRKCSKRQKSMHAHSFD